jgi:hypothetical protein
MVNKQVIPPLLLLIDLGRRIILDVILQLYDSACGRGKHRKAKSIIVFLPLPQTSIGTLILIPNQKIPGIGPFLLVGRRTIIPLAHIPSPVERQTQRCPAFP